MSDVRQWLDSLGLGEYADAFEKHAIGWEILSELDHDVLKDIGVGAAGHRLRILKAAKAVHDGDPVFASTAAKDRPAAPSPVVTAEAERRQLTVMFCDLVGSTELSQTLDPEELRELNRTYQDAAKASIERYGGYVARYMGDGVLAYFGYPQAHEDDPERAVRSGLELTEIVPGLSASPRLAVRIGIATGPVVVGDLVGEGASQESAVVGETPNLASRLQGHAEANSVVISDPTRALVEGLFDCADLGEVRLKGFSTGQRLWRVMGERQSESRFEALRSKKLTAFVGRDSELGLLLNRWESAVAGEGQVVLIEGEPGIGKSRLADELRRAIGSGAHKSLRYQCSPHHTNSAFWPFIVQLEHAGHILQGDAVDQRLDKLEQLLGEPTPECTKALWLFAKLLSLPTDRYPMLTLEPEELKSRTMAEFRGQLAALSGEAPVLVVFEDVHWIDPTSLELLGTMVQSGRNQPVLFIVTHRPEFESPLDAYGFVTKLHLNRLPRRDGASIIRQVAGGKGVPDEVVQQILEKTDGVALFVEELTKAVLEGGQLREVASSYILDGSLPELAIPSTLRDSLVARLDRIASAKEVAQAAACIGREFSVALLQAATGKDESEIDRALEQLVENELIYRRGASLESSYIFKHAMVQDAAYESLLIKKRKQYHSRIAEALEARGPDTTGAPAALIAHHWTRAEQFEHAAEYWRRAGENAFARRASREAARCYEQTLLALEQLPETEERLATEIDVRIELRNALFALGEFAQILECLKGAERVAQTLGDQHRLARVSCYLVQVISAVGDLDQAIALGERALVTAEDIGDFASQVMVNFLLSAAYYSVGNYVRSMDLASNDIAALKGEHLGEHFGLVGLPSVMARTWMSWSLAELGRYVEAVSIAQEGMRIAEECDHPYSTTIGIWGVADAYVLGGRFDEAHVLLERGLEMCRRWDFTYGLQRTAARLGHLYSLCDRPGAAIPLLEEAVRLAVSIEAPGYDAGAIRFLSEAYFLAGDRDAALDQAKRALTRSRQRKERGLEAWTLHLLGEIMSDPANTDADAANSYYGQSLSLAQELRMRLLVAHCHLGLGMLRQRTEPEGQGREHLSTAIALFDEMGINPPPRAEQWLERNGLADPETRAR